MKLKSLFILIPSLVFAAPKPKIDKAKEKAAVESATNWLHDVDSGNYENTWNNSAGIFKSRISATEWKKAATDARKTLGKNISRKIKSIQYATDLPQAPKGEYEVIQFDSVFENQKIATELITPMLEKDHKWHVSGYYIR